MATKKPLRGIRLRITAGTVLFTMLLSIAFGSACFYLFRGYARASVLRASEFSLQMVAGLVQQDLTELNSISSQLALNTDLIGYLSAADPTKRKLLDVYETANLLATRSRSYTYLQRLLITDGADRIVQISASPAYNVPISQYNVHEFPGIDSPIESIWQQVFQDPFASQSMSPSMLAMRPVSLPRTGRHLGTVYITASTKLITDRLKGFESTSGAQVFLGTSAGTWRIEGESLYTDEVAIVSARPDTTTARAATTTIQDITAADGKRYTLVSCPVNNFDISLACLMPAEDLFAQQSLLWSMIALTGLCVLAVGLVLFLYLNQLIVQPISKLRGRIHTISQGDFSTDSEIEWHNELGDVGRGVNQLSTNISTLMAKRVADEKERQSLEYKMLQNQVNPHFIYNTLNSIKWMATIQGATGIAEMTTAFSRLLKSVSKGSRPLITLREEFALLNDYCVIQQYRYGGAITIEIATISDESLCDCLIPSFSLQPLAENAIFHGIEAKGGVGSIWLHIQQQSNGDVLIAMQDDGIGMSAQAIDAVFTQGDDGDEPGYRQIGIRNVHRRIQYAFGAEYGLSISSKEGEFTRVELCIPSIVSDCGTEQEEP